MLLLAGRGSDRRSVTADSAVETTMLPQTDGLGAISVSVFGLALALLGLAWLVAALRLGTRGRRRLALAVAGLAAAAAGVAYFLEQPEWLWQPLLGLVAVTGAAALTCSAVPARLGWTLHRLVSYAPVQAAVLLLGGLLLAG